mmetsp:Transcript_12166/g.28672  ORF Transcript_12166/g.28672 Transcript_12166/m.28672 type:complete len:85 (+) Transcript_12166:1051-1305(+)
MLICSSIYLDDELNQIKTTQLKSSLPHEQPHHRAGSLICRRATVVFVDVSDLLSILFFQIQQFILHISNLLQQTLESIFFIFRR